MDKMTFILGIIVTILFTVYKYVEMQFILKESKPLKFLFRDAMVVYLCVLLSNFISQQFTNTKIVKAKNTEVFTNAPDF